MSCKQEWENKYFLAPSLPPKWSSLVYVQLCLEDFEWEVSYLNDEPGGGYALCYENLYEQDFLVWIFMKWELTTGFLLCYFWVLLNY